MEILGKISEPPRRNRTHDLPVTSLDALTTELWITYVVSRSQAWGYKSRDFASREYTRLSDSTCKRITIVYISCTDLFHSIGWLAGSFKKLIVLSKTTY